MTNRNHSTLLNEKVTYNNQQVNQEERKYNDKTRTNFVQIKETKITIKGGYQIKYQCNHLPVRIFEEAN